MSAPRPVWPPPEQRLPVWVPAMLAVTAVVAAVIGFLAASAPSICTPGVWL